MSNPRRVTFEQLVWLSGCLGLALLAQLTALPPWITAAIVGLTSLRLWLAVRGRDSPPRIVRAILALLSIGLLFMYFRTFNGLSAGTALLSLIAGLKFLETRTRRDIRVVTLIIYFLCLATLLAGESFWMLVYVIGVCWLTTAALLRAGDRPTEEWHRSLRYVGRLYVQAVPLALAFWLFFPRFDGPLWQVPENEGRATSGLGESMSPGDIAELALSDEVAFRVRFDAGGAPPPAARYWRGPVLHDFDGREWRRTAAAFGAAPLHFAGVSYRYTMSLEPNHHNWLFVLDWPSQWSAARGLLTNDYMLMQPTELVGPLDVTATSYVQVEAADPLDEDMRRRDLKLPGQRNPRTRQLAQELRAAHPDDLDYVHAVLDMFNSQPFYYTLTPPRLSDDSVDSFLFNTRRGFCGHYASAFAALMRAGHIPARIVTGYQGGTYNRFADYWIVRQSDAHAWNEVWLAGRGWLRVDPTGSIASQRIERGMNDLFQAGMPAASRWQQRARWPWLNDTRLRLDALRLLWRDRILRFDQGSQEKLLTYLHVADRNGRNIALILAACVMAGMGWLTWQVRREATIHPRDPLERAFARLLRRLAAVGIQRLPHEDAEAFGRRIAIERPELEASMSVLFRSYSRLRYARAPSPAAIAIFVAAVRRLRPLGAARGGRAAAKPSMQRGSHESS